MTTKEKIVLGFACLIVIAGVALASSGVLSKGGSPDAVFKQMAEARAAVTSSHVDATVTGDLTMGAGQSGHFVFKVNGVVSKKESASSADLHFSVTGSQAGSTELGVEGDARLLDRIFYLRATKIPPVIFIDPATVMNKWFSIDPIELYKSFGDQAKATELESALAAGSKMPAEFYQKTYSLAAEKGLIAGISAKGSEVISGVAAEKYQIMIDMKKLPDFLVAYTSLYNTYATQAGLKQIPQKTLTDEEKSYFNGITVSPFYMWVGKADHLVYKMSFTMNVVAPQGTTGGSGTIVFDVTMSDYNKAVTIEKPAPATPIQQLFQSMMGGNK